MLNKSKLLEYQLIDGKPYGGILFGESIIINEEYSWIGGMLEKYQSNLMDLLPKHLEIRHPSFIYRPPLSCILATLALKYMAWGRAFEVLRLIKKGYKAYKKAYINGRRKKIKIIY